MALKKVQVPILKGIQNFKQIERDIDVFGVMNQQFHDYFDKPLRHGNLDDEKLSRARIHMMLYKDFN
jgi:hypothetical protein